MNTYFIGQRVIYEDVICTVCTPKYTDSRNNLDKIVWLDNPERKYCHWASRDNVKPLPNGQL